MTLRAQLPAVAAHKIHDTYHKAIARNRGLSLGAIAHIVTSLCPIALAIGYMVTDVGPDWYSSRKYSSTAHVGLQEPNNSDNATLHTGAHYPGTHDPKPVTSNGYSRGFLAPYPRAETRVAHSVPPYFRVGSGASVAKAPSADGLKLRGLQEYHQVLNNVTFHNQFTGMAKYYYHTDTYTDGPSVSTHDLDPEVHDMRIIPKHLRWRYTAPIRNNKPGGLPLYRTDRPSKSWVRWFRYHSKRAVKSGLPGGVIACLYIGCMMNPHRGHRSEPSNAGGALPTLQNSSFNYRIPPSWGPEREHGPNPYRFRAFCTDVRLWASITDLPSSAQAAALVLRLTGQAYETGRAIPAEELQNGGYIRGVHYDGIGYVLAGLTMRYAQLGDESRLGAMMEFLNFQRLPGENINILLDRYDLVRRRAEDEGHFVMNVEMCSLTLMRCCGIGTHQMIEYLRPFGGRLPQDDNEFMELRANMRRNLHILENAPNNLGQVLSGHVPQARSGWYHTDTEPEVTQSFWTHSGSSAGQQMPPEPQSGGGAYPTNTAPSSEAGDPPEMVDSSSGTDSDQDGSDTSSDNGSQDVSDLMPGPEVPEDQAAVQLLFKYRRARRAWRRFTKRPVRRFRRVIRKFKRRSWRAAKRRSPGGFNNLGAGYRPNFQGPRRRKRFGRAFYENTPDHAIMVDGMNLDTYFKKKAKGKSKSSSGYGFGRSSSSQPKGKGGGSLSGCFRCGKPGHMAKDCPEQPSKGNGKGNNNAPTFAQTTSEQVGVPEFLLMQPGTTNIDSRPLQGYGFIEEPVDEALSFGVHAPLSDPIPVPAQRIADAGPLADLLGSVVPSTMEGTMNPVFMLTTEQEDRELREVEDFMQKGDPWQGKALGRAMMPKAKSTGNLQESFLKNTDWSKWKTGMAEAPQRESIITRPLSPKARDLEQRYRDDPGAMFGDDGNNAVVEPNHTSWWARTHCMQEPPRQPYDPAIGNRKPANAAEDILWQIQREQAAHSQPVRKPSAFAEAFKERTPHGRPDPKMFNRPNLPFQVENHWPARDASYDQSGRTTSWWGAGTDAHAKGLSFSNEGRVTACDGCQAPTTAAPCSICRMLYCDGCHQWGKHKFCHPPGGAASRPAPPGAPQPAISGHWMQPLPSEPDFCRGRPVQLRVDEHIREMREIKTLSDNNRLLDADRKQKYWGIKKDHDRDRDSEVRSFYSQESGAKGKGKGRPSSLIDSDAYGPSRQRPETEKWAPFGTPSFSQSQAPPSAEARVHTDIPKPSADDLCTLPEAYRATQRDTVVPQCGVCAGTFTIEQYCLRLTCQHKYHAHCWHAYTEHSPSAARGPTAEVPRSCKECGTEGKIDDIWQIKASAQAQGKPQLFDIAGGDVYHDSRSRSNSRPRENHETLGSLASWQLATTDVAVQSATQPVFQATPRSHGTPSVAGSNDLVQYPIFGETEEDVANWGYECSLNPSARPAEALATAYGNADEPGLDSQVKTRLKGKTAVLVDVGAVGNLAGSEWARELATKALKTGRKPREEQRTRGLKVAGVGTGSQTCQYDVHLPCAIPLADGGVLKCTFTTPTVPNSTLPALLGLQSLKNSRAIIDTNDSKVYFLGPGDYDLMKGLPPGTKQIQCEHAPSGHMMMPVDSYDELDKLERQGGLTIEETVLPVKTQES